MAKKQKKKENTSKKDVKKQPEKKVKIKKEKVSEKKTQNKEEFKTTVKVTGLGAAVIGALGFIIFLIKQLLF